ncbi:MAG TPA: Uma2 family endonuclease [Gammaproteobacteria bacterium]|jgi:Uma2 family endonuclease|nr:Uma2 family endonuclease [Gammaproteobacteria bacterium]
MSALAEPRPAARLTPSELCRRWQEMLEDPLLEAVPFKVELSEKGAVEVSPAGTRHGVLQAFVARELHRLRPDGTAITECAVLTEIGVRVPDVIWASAEFMRRHGLTSPFPTAPEVCIEIVSPSNRVAQMEEKKAAYLAAGAIEVWLVPEYGAAQIFGADGPVDASRFGFEFLLPP